MKKLLLATALLSTISAFGMKSDPDQTIKDKILELKKLNSRSILASPWLEANQEERYSLMMQAKEKREQLVSQIIDLSGKSSSYKYLSNPSRVMMHVHHAKTEKEKMQQSKQLKKLTFS